VEAVRDRPAHPPGPSSAPAGRRVEGSPQLVRGAPQPWRHALVARRRRWFASGLPAQLDLEVLRAVGGPSPLPASSALAFFVGTDPRAPCAVRHVPAGAPETRAPDDAFPVDQILGGYPADRQLDTALRTFPRWPVGFRRLACPLASTPTKPPTPSTSRRPTRSPRTCRTGRTSCRRSRCSRSPRRARPRLVGLRPAIRPPAPRGPGRPRPIAVPRLPRALAPGAPRHRTLTPWASRVHGGHRGSSTESRPDGLEIRTAIVVAVPGRAITFAGRPLDELDAERYVLAGWSSDVDQATAPALRQASCERSPRRACCRSGADSTRRRAAAHRTARRRVSATRSEGGRRARSHAVGPLDRLGEQGGLADGNPDQGLDTVFQDLATVLANLTGLTTLLNHNCMGSQADDCQSAPTAHLPLRRSLIRSFDRLLS